MNARWRERELTLCGVPLETVTYSIVPLGDAAGLVQAVPSSRTLRQLCRGFSLEDRHLRVLHALQGSVTRLDRTPPATKAGGLNGRVPDRLLLPRRRRRARR
ncbi:unnamed protein product [Prorocentrum cordatum]|uniref:Uncharacterized protein n=1 Tax=Prorocentrum cordatum TaxID=2364126 RepID=A0ABN9XRP5_9DINO|nr:unnamed protein product [Polarella glacialis]